MDPAPNIDAILRALREADLRQRRAEIVAQLSEIDRALAQLGADPGNAREWISTADPHFEGVSGHKPRSVVEAIRARELNGTKLTKGFRVAIADLRAWEAERDAKRRARLAKRARVPADHAPANDSQADLDRALMGGARVSR